MNKQKYQEELKNMEAEFGKFERDFQRGVQTGSVLALQLSDKLPDIPEGYEVLSEEWIDENSEIMRPLYSADTPKAVKEHKLKKLLIPNTQSKTGQNATDTQSAEVRQDSKSADKVKIPQFIAEWIEDNWDNFSEKHKLISLFLSGTKHSKSTQDCYKWSRVKGNMDLFMQALVNGYEVEEPLYTVTLANGKILGKRNNSLEFYDDFDTHYMHVIDNLTQSEIESVDPVLMGIAVEVEKMAEYNEIFSPKEDLIEWITDNWDFVEDDIRLSVSTVLDRPYFSKDDSMDRDTLVDFVSEKIKTGILNVVSTYEDEEVE